MPCLCLRDGEKCSGHVCPGANRQYQARVRWHGYQRYQLLGKPSRSNKAAMRRLADAMATGLYKRGDVLLLADWYDSVPIVETVRL